MDKQPTQLFSMIKSDIRFLYVEVQLSGTIVHQSNFFLWSNNLYEKVMSIIRWKIKTNYFVTIFHLINSLAEHIINRQSALFYCIYLCKQLLISAFKIGKDLKSWVGYIS